MPSSLITALQPNRPADIDVRDTLTDDDQHVLLRALAAVADPRDPRGIRYRLTSLLAVSVCAVLAWAATFAAIGDWAGDLDSPTRGRLGFAGAIPAGSTVWRFLVRLDAQTLQSVLTGWLRARITPPAQARPQRRARIIVAVDGKVLRGARLREGRQVHLVPFGNPVRLRSLGVLTHQATEDLPAAHP